MAEVGAHDQQHLVIEPVGQRVGQFLRVNLAVTMDTSEKFLSVFWRNGTWTSPEMLPPLRRRFARLPGLRVLGNTFRFEHKRLGFAHCGLSEIVARAKRRPVNVRGANDAPRNSA